MVSQTLVIRARRKQLLHMFNLRGLFCSAKDFHFVVVLLSAIIILVTCKQCVVKDVPNHCKFEACTSCKGNFDSPDVFENECDPSNSFCFPSNLSGFEGDKIDVELELLDASEVQSEGLSSGLEQKSELCQLPYNRNFRYLGERNISCSLYQENGFPEFSSCVSPLFDKETHSSISMGNPESVKFSFVGGFSTPPVEIKPSLLDWGHKNMYNPTLAYLTIKNLDIDSVLSVFDLYSTDSQFYPCNFISMSLAPGEKASICFVFFPTHLGLSSAKLIIQTSFGGLLIQAKGFSVESPYLINHIGGLEILSPGRWRKNLSLFNPFNEALHVEELIAWISTSSGDTTRSSKSICRTHSMEYPNDYSILNAKDWLAVERGQPQIALRPHKNWVVGPKKTEEVVELDILGHFEGKIAGAFCVQLLRSSNNEIDTVMIPLEAELSPRTTALDKAFVSLSLEAMVPCNASGSIGVALSVRNDAPYSLSVIKVSEIGESVATFKIKSVEGLTLFPSTATQVAFINYAHLETREVNTNCKIIVLVNDTRFSQMEIPCADVIGVCSGLRFDSSVQYTQGINVDYVNGGDRIFSSSMVPSSGVKVVNTRDPDESILRNWKSQATDNSMSLLDKNELQFPVVLVGNYSSQWISVKNPSHKPVVMQLILNSGEIIENCRIPETLLQPSSSITLVGNNSIAPTKYGFSIPKDALTEALIHPHGSAVLGPILFQPSNRCQWRSSALIRNNLSGVEWLSLQAYGGSLSLILHEGYDPVQDLEFKLNMPTRLNFSSPGALHSAGGDISYCYQSLKKDVYAKNMGDLPIEVIRIKVSGAACGLDGFIIRNCTGFSLQPGESATLRMSYKADFTAATVHRDLELASSAGILVIPMKASVPMCLLEFCKRSMFWMRVKKAMLMLLFAVSLVYFIVSLMFPHFTTTFVSQDFVSGKKDSFSSAIMRFNWKNSDPMFPEISREEALLVKCCDGLTPDEGNVTPSAVVSSPSSVLSLDMQETLDSGNLRVKVGKEKVKRRRKKRSSGVGVLLYEASSSQSSNSTPSSPLSPGPTCTTPKRSVEARNPFSRAPLDQNDIIKSSKIPSKIERSDNEVPSKRENNWGSSAQEKLYLTKKVASKPVPPSVMFSSASGPVVPPWTCRSSLLASSSTIAPHARAPGTKLQNQGAHKASCIEQKYTYDIWGDHLFGLPSTYHQSKKVPSKASSSSIENNSESFFVRGPQALVKNSRISDLEGNE